MKIRAIITGTTGMVGEGVLSECISHPDVEQILVISRRTCGITHPKLTEVLHSDFFNLTPVADRLKGYNACFFCLGVSSVGMKEEKYFSLTYTLTMNFAGLVATRNPDMTFCYVSGAATDSSEKGRVNWARVKGKTENELMKLPFKKAFACRPGFMLPARGAKNVPGFYFIFRFLYPLLKAIFPKHVSTLKEVALAMINSVIYGYEKSILEVEDLIELSKRK
jgi:hypothetical protein